MVQYLAFDFIHRCRGPVPFHLLLHFNIVFTMEEETLNIEYHLKRRVLKALNKFKKDFEAAEELGIASGTLYRYKQRFNIERCPVTKEYSFREKLVLNGS